MPVRFIVIGIEWIKSVASRWCLWLIFQNTLETVRLSPPVLSFFKNWKVLWPGTCYFPPILLGTYYCTAPHVLFTQIAWLYHVSLKFFLPAVTALMSNSLCMIYFFSCLSLSLSYSHSNDSFDNIQGAYLERKKISRKKNIFSYSRFSPILKYDILFIL